jgi:hypothetical protein
VAPNSTVTSSPQPLLYSEKSSLHSISDKQSNNKRGLGSDRLGGGGLSLPEVKGASDGVSMNLLID